MQVKRELGCAYKTAWFLSHPIRDEKFGLLPRYGDRRTL
jgi:hypothetical protein